MTSSPLADRIFAGDRVGLGRLLEGLDPANAWRDNVLPSALAAVERYTRGDVILPGLLASLEVVHAAREHIGPDTSQPRGTIVVATLKGDVHHIGTALLVTLLENVGYRVHDLGTEASIEAIIDTAVATNADAIGLSALLVTSSRQMPACIQALDAHGLDIPVLVGGAAINRAFGRASGVLSDGRVYSAGVFYCRDVFEGLETMDALTDPSRRSAVIEEVRREIEAERQHVGTSTSRGASSPHRRVALRDAEVPSTAHWGVHARRVDLPEVWPLLDRNTLFRFHWGGYRARDAAYTAQMQSWLQELTEDALRQGWLEARVVTGTFPCNADGDTLMVFDTAEPSRQVARLDFPRQPDGERLCLADYFRRLASHQRDVVVFQAVTVGPRPGELIDALQRSGEYVKMLLVNGLASATAEALADYAHALVRTELGLPADRGLRFSWGYAACPDLADQRTVLPLLHADGEIGLRLTESDTLAPEHSTVAMVVHHPDAKYFSVR